MRSPFEQEYPGGSESANASVVALVHAGEAFLAVITRVLRRYGLSPAGAQVLAIIEGAGQPLSPTVVAERLIVSTATVTTLIDTLERRGLVIRRPDPSDRRRILVELTDEAYEVIDAFLPEIVAIQTAVMAGVTESERAALRRALASIQACLDAVDVDVIIANARPRRRPQRA